MATYCKWLVIPSSHYVCCLFVFIAFYEFWFATTRLRGLHLFNDTRIFVEEVVQLFEQVPDQTCSVRFNEGCSGRPYQ